MDDTTFNNQLGQVLSKLGNVSAEDRAKIEQFALALRQRHQKMRTTLGELQNSLDHLRLSVKYLVFDLEATRRENEYLRRLIDSQGND